MNNRKSLLYFLIATSITFLLVNCGGGGGGSTDVVPPVTTSEGFTATADNKIEGGQLEFAFGQTATFDAKDITGESWSTINGEVATTGQYQTPWDLSTITNDTITMTSSSDVDTRTFLVSPFPKFSGTYYNYRNGNQKYSVPLSATEALGVATFQNNSITSGEGNIKIKNLNASSAKKEPVISKKMLSLIEHDDRYLAPKRNNITDPLKFSQKKNQIQKKQKKSNRAADALGTRDTFFHDEGQSEVKSPLKKFTLAQNVSFIQR